MFISITRLNYLNDLGLNYSFTSTLAIFTRFIIYLLFEMAFIIHYYLIIKISVAQIVTNHTLHNQILPNNINGNKQPTLLEPKTWKKMYKSNLSF